MQLKKTTKDIVGSSIMLGVGGAALQGMGQGSIATQTIGKAGGMMGAVIPSAFGIGIMRFAEQKGRKLQRGMKKSRFGGF